MNEDIRKIAVGPDYKQAMHYVVGNGVLGDSHSVCEILKELDADGDIMYYVYITDGSVIKRWKAFNKRTTPVQVEYNINF